MTHFTEFDPGTFAWVDINSTDIDQSVAFFSELFDLETTQVPVPDSPPYVLMKKDGKQAWGGYPLPEEMKAQGTPSIFLSYVSVPDVAAAVEKAGTLGGNTLVEPMDVGGGTRVAVVADPTGAAIGLISPPDEPQTIVANEHGTLLWNELLTNDVDAARTFYTTLFGWQAADMDMADGRTYTVFKDGDKTRAGGMAIREEWGEMPPNWFVYFQVDDVDRIVAKAKELGGSTPMEPMDVPQVGRMAQVADPTGAVCAVMNAENPGG